MSEAALLTDVGEPEVGALSPSLHSLLVKGLDPAQRRELKYNEPKYLRPVHKKILALSAAGVPNYEIADMLKLSEAWVSVVINHPEAQIIRSEMTAEYVVGLLGDTRDVINAHTAEAVGHIVTLMRTGKDNVRLAAAKDILDRGGFKPVERTISANVTLTPNDAASITQALRETVAPVEDLEEAEFTSAVFDEVKSGSNSDGA